MDILLATNAVETVSAGKEAMYLTSSIVMLLIALVCIFVIIGFFTLLSRWMRSSFNKDEKYNLFEMAALRKTAENAGIDLSTEARLQSIENGRTFRRRLEEKIVKDVLDESE